MDNAWTAQLRKGLVELAVLAALNGGEAYGYQLLGRINAFPGLNLNEPTVYPLLARLTRAGYLTVRSGPSPHGPPRRYYCLTESGRDRLKQMRTLWQTTNESLTQLIQQGDES